MKKERIQNLFDSAAEFVTDFYTVHTTWKENGNEIANAFSESAKLLVNGIVVYCSWDGNQVSVKIYDHNFCEEIGDIANEDQLFHICKNIIPYVLTNFYRRYVEDCYRNQNPIFLPDGSVFRYSYQRKLFISDTLESVNPFSECEKLAADENCPFWWN